MRLISCHDGKLLTIDSDAPLTPGGAASKGKTFSSGLPDLDALAPGGGFARGAVHELLAEPGDGQALFVAMLLALGAGGASIEGENIATDERPMSTDKDNSPPAGGTEQSHLTPDPLLSPRPVLRERVRVRAFSEETAKKALPPALSRSTGRGSKKSDVIAPARGIVWCDPAGELYPPALAAYGFPLDRLLLLEPPGPDPGSKNLIWATVECLRCKGISAVVAPIGRLSRIEARRLQLAAESGGGVGLLLRPLGKASQHHAAASRWIIRPAPGSRTIQRWTIQLLHGHGGRVGQTLCLEHCRETHRLHTSAPMADRSASPSKIESPIRAHAS